jgi:hypothetical protein
VGVAELLEAFLQAVGPLAPFGLDFQFDRFPRGNTPSLRCVFAHALRPAVSLGGTPGLISTLLPPSHGEKMRPWAELGTKTF